MAHIPNLEIINGNLSHLTNAGVMIFSSMTITKFFVTPNGYPTIIPLEMLPHQRRLVDARLCAIVVLLRDLL